MSSIERLSVQNLDELETCLIYAADGFVRVHRSEFAALLATARRERPQTEQITALIETVDALNILAERWRAIEEAARALMRPWTAGNGPPRGAAELDALSAALAAPSATTSIYNDAVLPITPCAPSATDKGET